MFGKNKQVKPKISLFDRLMGQKEPDIDSIDLSGIDTSNPYFAENTGMDEPQVKISTSQNPRVGGILPDMLNGFKENRDNGFSLNNYGNNTLSDGRNKGFAYRLGEFGGSLARIGESPLGRGLLTGAAIAALGGTPAETLAYGATAGALNQGNRNRDAIYRQQLEAQGIDTSGLNGYITDSTYKNILDAKTLQDNAEYRNAVLANQAMQNQITNLLRRDQLARQEKQDQLNNYYQNQRIAQGWANLNDRQQAREEARIAKNNADTYGDIQAQLDNFAKTFKTVNNPYRYRVWGGASEALNTLSNEEANFNAQRTLLFNQIARKLGGEKGVLSDKDIQRVEAALPKLTDTYEQKMAKLDAVYGLLDIKRGSANQALNNINATNDDEGWAF